MTLFTPVTDPRPATTPATAPVPQPFLHELVSCVRAPTVALSGFDGQIRAGAAHGLFHQDRRSIATLTVDVDGHEPVPVGRHQHDADTAQFVTVVRHLGDPGADPTVRLERVRRLAGSGMTEQLTLINAARQPIRASVRVQVGVDFAAMDTVKHGAQVTLVPPERAGADTAGWARAGSQAWLHAAGDPELSLVDARLWLTWRVTVPPRRQWETTLTVTTAADPGAAQAPAPAPAPAHRPDHGARFGPATGGPGWDPVHITAPYDLTRLVDRSVADVAALVLADPLGGTDAFAAAGSPWFLTLFGRDSLWTARLTLPLGTELAGGTLRALARRQGTRADPETAEEPGKIPHEIRGEPGGIGGLPPVYYGTVDATALWICLLHDAWRWGMPHEEVAGLLPALEAALSWLVESTAGGDGFLDYFDRTGRGLVNQGWKDSGDAIQFPDGTLAEPPIALSEAQAYAYEAAISGAALLAAFGRPGAEASREWAQQLADRFREAFWVRDDRGRFPAIALDAAKRPVPTATSNLGHLLATGLLNPAEAGTVAARLGQRDLDCGYGLRTLSADATGFNPLGYHAGTVWPHDTAIAVRGLTLAGHPTVAASLANGLVRAAPVFGHRFPELFAGTDAQAGEAVLAYPAACRPQAWSAAAAIALLHTALGLHADVPNRRLVVSPCQELAEWFPVRVSGLRVAGHPLTVSVDATGHPRVETTAGVTIVA